MLVPAPSPKYAPLPHWRTDGNVMSPPLVVVVVVVATVEVVSGAGDGSAVGVGEVVTGAGVVMAVSGVVTAVVMGAGSFASGMLRELVADRAEAEADDPLVPFDDVPVSPREPVVLPAEPDM